MNGRGRWPAIRCWARAVALAVCAAWPAAHASPPGAAPEPPSGAAVWQHACLRCHRGFAPDFLPVRSWRRVLDAVPGHFGASLAMGPDQRRALLGYLLAHAADVSNSPTARAVMARLADTDHPARVTATRWFRHLHQRVPRVTWSRGKVGSAANCGACHPDVERGIFDGRRVLIPE